jgi:hypothetical protein
MAKSRTRNRDASVIDRKLLGKGPIGELAASCLSLRT